MKNKKIIIIAGKGDSTNIIYNALNDRFGIYNVILEEKESSKVFLKRRVKRLGLLTVIGQLVFQLGVSKILKISSKKRILTILCEKKMDVNEIPANKIKHVTSINSQATIDLINGIEPDLIIVNGTRIISKKVLQSISCRFINTHAGITPMYRGVHGAYWALVNNDVSNVGVTVHFIDEGIDTGSIISQANVIPLPEDNFATYPFLQLSVGLDILIKSIEYHFDKGVIVQEVVGKSNLYYHPTICQYIYYRVIKNVK